MKKLKSVLVMIIIGAGIVMNASEIETIIRPTEKKEIKNLFPGLTNHLQKQAYKSSIVSLI